MQWNEFSFRLRHLPIADQKQIEEAFQLGERLHRGQNRLSGEPFFNHPIAVATILINLGADAETIIAALLHDTVEDTSYALSDVQEAFGETVASLVDGVTKLRGQELATPSLDEQIETLRKIFVLMQKDIRIMIIKLADRLHNMQTISFRAGVKQQLVAKQTLDVFVKIADRLCIRDIRDELEAMCLHVLDPELYEQLMMLRKKNENRGQQLARTINDQVSSRFPAFDATLKYEYKSLGNLRLQYELEGDGETGISPYNISFTCKSVEDCYQTLGMLHQLWQRETLTFEDYINAPIINGYKGLHTTIILQDGARIRCKIRTQEMEDYSHRGITLYCFGKKKRGLLDQLPWVEHISPLSADTATKSETFWERLQTDILSESIIIHGSANQVVLVPKGSTALDGIFYLHGMQALQTASILLNGKSVPFYEELSHADTLTATFADSPQVILTWLQYSHTGIAASMIREGLTELPHAQKEVIGKELLARAVHERGRIALDELDASVLKKQLISLGFTTPSQLFVLIAEGKADPDAIANEIFKEKKTPNEQNTWSLSLQYPHQDNSRIEKVIRMFPFFKLRFIAGRRDVHLTAKYLLNDAQARQLHMQLETVIPTKHWKLTNERKYFGILLGALFLIILWGLDPVFARLFLVDSINPYDLTILRFITFFLAASAVYALQPYLTKQRLKPLNPFQPSLILSGVSLFVTGLFTYITLEYVPATLYILFIIAGIILSEIVIALMHGQKVARLVLGFALLTFGIVVLAIQYDALTMGLLSAVCASLSFQLYSHVSRRFQQEVAIIQGRYPAFLFWVSLVCVFMTILLIPSARIFTLPPAIILTAVAFTLVFVLLPYVLFFECNRRFNGARLDHSLPLVGLFTMVGEMAIYQSFTPFLIAPMLMGLYLIKKWQ